MFVLGQIGVGKCLSVVASFELEAEAAAHGNERAHGRLHDRGGVRARVVQALDHLVAARDGA